MQINRKIDRHNKIYKQSQMNAPKKIKRTLPSITMFYSRQSHEEASPKEKQNIQMASKLLHIEESNIKKFQLGQSPQNHNKKVVFDNFSSSGRNSSIMRQSSREKKLAKTVTFVDNDFGYQIRKIQGRNQQANKLMDIVKMQQKNKSPGRNYKRKSIFEQKSKQRVLHQPHDSKISKGEAESNRKHNDIGSQVIPVIMNIKQFSDIIKKSEQQRNRDVNKNEMVERKSLEGADQDRLLKKISHIEHIIQDIQQKMIEKSDQKEKYVVKMVQDNQQRQKKKKQKQKSHQAQKNLQLKNTNQRQRNYSALQRSQSEIENHLLKLQLEQMRRCERIAKQNEILYGILVKNIQQGQDEMKNSRKSSIPVSHIKPSKSNSNQKQTNSKPLDINAKAKAILNNNINFIYSNHDKRYRPSGPNITAFEDFIEARQLPQNKYSDQNVEICSPFQIQENRSRNYDF